MSDPNKENFCSISWHDFLTYTWLFPIRFLMQTFTLKEEIKNNSNVDLLLLLVLSSIFFWGGIFYIVLWIIIDHLETGYLVFFILINTFLAIVGYALIKCYRYTNKAIMGIVRVISMISLFNLVVLLFLTMFSGGLLSIVIIGYEIYAELGFTTEFIQDQPEPNSFLVHIIILTIPILLGAFGVMIGSLSILPIYFLTTTIHQASNSIVIGVFSLIHLILASIIYILYTFLPWGVTTLSTFVMLLYIWRIINDFFEKSFFPHWAENILISLCLILFVISVFIYIPRLSTTSMLLSSFGLLIGIFTGNTYLLILGGALRKDNFNTTNTQYFYLSHFWGISLILGSLIWGISSGIKNLELLAYALFIFAPIATGLVFYPFMILLHWQQAKQAKYLIINNLWIMRWQTFAYPLPFFKLLLSNYQKQHGIPATVKLIKILQLKTLQIKSLTNAIKYLAQQPIYAFEFCGHMAISSSIDSTLPLSQTGKAGESIACLIKKNNKEEERKKFSTYVTPYLSKSGFSLFKSNVKNNGIIEGDINLFEIIRDKSLNERVMYALTILQKCKQFTQFNDVCTILITLQQTSQARNIAELFTLEIVVPQKSPDWITPIWTCLNDIYPILKTLQEAYPTLSSENARRQLIQQTSKELEKIDWSKQPEYWANIAIELRQHWLTILEKAAEQAKEWLHLEITTPPQALFTGTNQLFLQLYNPSSILAQHIEVNLNTTDGLHLVSSTFKQRFLEEKSHCELLIPIEIEQAGSYQLQGTLTAEDLEGNPVHYTINETLLIENQEQNRYQIIEESPYETGAGLSTDEVFIGRQTVLTELYKFWQRPQGQIAVRIVGQRRIGKTSILNKIHRDASKHCPLIPIFVSFQGIADEYDFLRETSREMASSLNIKVERFDRDYARTDFKDFLNSTEVKNHLNNRRFLLLLDEADLMPQQGLGTLPGFLRDLMQQAKYPTLLLFCGTPNLLAMSEDYDSILFNTTQDFTISYLNESESKQLLQQPVQDELQFDDVVLSHAYRLTHGQPLLIQSLGYRVIKYFNEYVEHSERNNIVSLRDLNNAADNLIKEGSAAFTQSWSDTDDTSHLILSTLAWATDEDDQNRLKRTLDGIMLDLAEFQFTIERAKVFDCLEKLSKNEFLLNQGNTYQFSVPLYRRWILWRYPPEKLREAIGR